MLVATGMDTGFSGRQLSLYDLIAVIVLAVPAGFLFIVSTTGIISYFVFMPSITHDGHLFSRIHGTQFIHPLTTSVVLGLSALCVYTGSVAAWIFWGGLTALFVFHTALMVRRVLREHLMNGPGGEREGIFFLVLHLILGTEIVTVAAGARPLPPWRLQSLPEDTWIVDVRTKPEFYWNRLQGAENFPWGAGVIEAAASRSKDRPVLVTCFSGHRSPTIAVLLRKLGFNTVYNLNWGILYLILLERGRKGEGPFSLTRPHRDPGRRGEDVRSLSIAYVTLQALILILAPLENSVRDIHVSTIHRAIGGILGLVGLVISLVSYKALGRNFRVYAAPRRSGTLITSGIYSWVRHPMYTGVIMMFAGYILWWWGLYSIPLWLTFSVLYLMKAVKEERILAHRFPEYEDYCKRTWKFLPFLY